MNTPTCQIFRSAIFHCLEKNNGVVAEYFADGLLIVENGYIKQIGEYCKLKDEIGVDVPITHLENTLITPGFIDTHVHYPQYRVIGSYGESLTGWLNKYAFKEEAKFDAEEYAQQTAALFFDEIIRNGTTTAMSFCTVHKHSVEAFFNAAKTRNLRMIGGKVLMDRNAPDELCDTPQSGYDDSQALIEKWHGSGRLTYALTPRFAPTSTPEQLASAGKLYRQYPDIHMQTHLNENIDEIKWVRTLFPERKHYVDVYDYYQLLGEKSVFGHCLHNDEDELKRLADSGAKVALCPRSNLFLGSGLFDLNTLEQAGIVCALASDVGGGDSFSMFAVMNEAYKVSRLQGINLDPVKAFYLSTLSAAKVAGLDKYIGNFAVGKEADFLVLNLTPTPLMTEKFNCAKDINDILFSLITLGDERVVKQVFIMGECIHTTDHRRNN